MSKASDALQAAFLADPNAILAIICNKVPCNQKLADDPFVQVDHAKTLPGNHWQVGALGLINAVLHAHGLPMVAMQFSITVDQDLRHTLLGFCEYTTPEQRSHATADNPEILTPWAARASELEPIHGPYCVYAAWAEWFQSWNDNQAESMQLEIDDLDLTSLFSAFQDACSACLIKQKKP